MGAIAGYVSAAALLTGTILFLLDATNVLGDNKARPIPGASPLQNEAHYWVGQFAYQHHILWDIIARDTLLPLAFLALVVLALAVRALSRSDGPDGQLMVVFFAIGGTLSALADLIYLGATDYWRLTGWSHLNTVSMVAAARSASTIDSLTRWPEAAGFIVLAAALLCLGNLCRSQAGLPSVLGLVAYLEAALLVGIAVAGVMQSDTAYNIFSLLTGALVGPLVAAALGRHLARATHP